MARIVRVVALGCIVTVMSTSGCAPAVRTTDAAARPALKDVFADYFLVGAALNARQIRAEDARGTAIVVTHFNTITPENDLKWERVHPEPTRYAFDVPDQFVTFGERHHMFIVGHTLVWHNQTPRWVFEDASGRPVSRDTLRGRLREHIATVVGRYRGRIDGWDVVNEALDEDGTLRQSPWLRILGEDYIALAFRLAHEADPDAELYYNDYSLPNPAKRAGVVRLVARLKEQGVPITGVGLQDHIHLDEPSIAQMDSTITALGALGMKVMITELDVDVLPSVTGGQGADVAQGGVMQEGLNPYTEEFPDSGQQALSQRYADVFALYLKNHDVITRVTFWGVTDADSWKNNWPIRGRTNYPLLFDRGGQPKPAFAAVVGTARAAGRNN